MTDAGIVLRKLSVLHEHLDRVRRRRPVEVARFVSEPDLQDALALSLLVAAQEAIDIAMHICSDDGYGLPASYGEAFELLGRHGVLPVELAVELARVAALRNRLAHGYASVDPARVWAELPAGIAALERFCALIAARVAPSR